MMRRISSSSNRNSEIVGITFQANTLRSMQRWMRRAPAIKGVDSGEKPVEWAGTSMRYMAEFQYRFNRRFDLAKLMPALLASCGIQRPATEAAIRTAMPAELGSQSGTVKHNNSRDANTANGWLRSRIPSKPGARKVRRAHHANPSGNSSPDNESRRLLA
jgi:hypothetical protein